MATNNYLVTHSGIRFDLLNPTVEQVDLDDILFALSNLNRYTGHVGPYSVLEHTIHVADCVRKLFYEINPSWYWTTQIATQEALIHDMAEAYTGDISTPMKQLLGPAFCEVEARINRVIRQKFEIPDVPEIPDGCFSERVPAPQLRRTGHAYRIMQQADEMVTHAEALHFLGKDQADWATKPWPRFRPFGPRYYYQRKSVSAFDYQKSVFMRLWEYCRS